MFRLTKPTIQSPNFSVILPGPCNAACPFCFWTRSRAEDPMFPEHLTWYLETLGSALTQISLTGGEPTLSPIFPQVLKALVKFNQHKIVLTTNGANLKECIPMMKGVVRHINLSRHAVHDAENWVIFKTEDVPGFAELTALCEQANRNSMDVTLNFVAVPDWSNQAEFQAMIELVRDVGASALAIRKDYRDNTLTPLPVEVNLGMVPQTTRSCPVCSTTSYYVQGVPVHFKASLAEPSDSVPKEIYEFVLHPDGRLCEDWQGKKQIHFEAGCNPVPQQITMLVACAQPRVYELNCGPSRGC